MAATARAPDTELDAVLAEIDADIELASRLVARAGKRGGAVDVAALRRALGAVEARRRDPCLYLAVVGEFSSGKTSFTNVLLGERLLQTSPLANTAAVTAIRRGPRPSLRVRFHGEQLEVRHPSSDLEARLGAVGGHAGSLREALHVLTGDERVAPMVERVEVEHPSSALGDDIVVLDTPGINSADEAHTSTALATIARSADAFVVLVPSNAPVSMRLQELLHHQLRPHLHRTTFVVTHMAHVPPQERAAVLGVVERRLRQDHGVAAPVVEAASLGAAMRARVGDPAATAEDAGWLDAFEALRGRLVARLRRERAVTVAERVVVLLHEAMELLQSSLRAEGRALSEAADVLARNAPADLERFCTREEQDLRASVDAQLHAARSRIETAVEGLRRAALEQIRRDLEHASTPAELDQAIDAAPAVLERQLHALRDELSASTRAMAADVRARATGLDRRFERHFGGLDRLAGKAFRATRASLPTGAATDLGVSAAVRTLRRERDRRQARRIAGGAGLGAIIGTLLAPGVGTLVGAGIGGALGSDSEDTGLAERRRSYWALLEPEVERALDDPRRRALQVLDRQAASATRHLDARVARYRRTYAQRIRELDAAQAAALEDLERRSAQAARDMQEVEARMQRLRARARSVAAMSPSALGAAASRL